MTEIDKIIRPAEAARMTGRSLTSIWRDEREGHFPRRIKIGQNAVGYRLSDLQQWIASREDVTPENTKAVAPGAPKGRRRRGE